MRAFHAYDIRGIWNKDFDKDDVYKIGFYLPSLLEADKVLVGRDARISSPEVFESLVKGITDAGVDVYNIGIGTTPMVYFGTVKHGFEASVQITASHNAKEYNGLKVSCKGAMPVGYDNGLGELEKTINASIPEPATVKGSVIDLDIKDEYIAFLSGRRQGEMINDGIYHPKITQKDYTIDPDNDTMETIDRKTRAAAYIA